MGTIENKLRSIVAKEGFERMNSLIELLQQDEDCNGNSGLFMQAVTAVITDMSIPSKEKLRFGELLNRWGDPRLRSADDDDYWITVEDLDIQVARFVVTIKEWRAFLTRGYDEQECWSEEGWAWKDEDHPSWNELASADSAQKYLFDNQPVVGVSWFEAEAFAAFHNARLMEFYEHERLIRGDNKNPYPWGSPFGHGNANTVEEKLKKPTAVGLYCTDSVFGEIFDLVGNVGEWMNDIVDDRRVIHPGAWDVDSLGSWAKASSLISPSARTGNIGFRLVRDIE